MSRRIARLTPVVALAAALTLSGCAPLIDGIIGGCGNSVGNSVGNQIGRSIPTVAAPSGGRRSGGDGGGMVYNPMFAGIYTQFLFTMAFGAGGYDMSNVPYKKGEYAVWSMPDDENEGGTIERAFLGEDAKGQQWWRVRFTGDEASETTVLEGLFAKDLSRLVRLRGKFPGDKEGKEMPVEEQSYYLAPRRLSPESVQGATKGVESITVPAGTFQARHIVFGNAGGSAEWWVADGVPGGLVKQLSKDSDSDTSQNTLVLQRYGKDAKSELGSL